MRLIKKYWWVLLILSFFVFKEFWATVFVKVFGNKPGKGTPQEPPPKQG